MLMPRIFDIVLAAVALALLSPFLLAAAIAIRVGSRGPVFYRQRRVGLDGREFEMLKLRTMVQGSDPVGVGTVVTREDPRVTRAGRFLRRTSLDEVPNLINVLRGEMAIVGPRPTGCAQVQGRAGIPWEERIELDVWYVEHRDLAFDLRILARTVRLVLTGHGLSPDYAP